jgi:hypothetical protein
MSQLRARRLLREMGFDLRDQPDWIDPRKKRSISGQQDPLARNPAWPQQKPTRRAGAPYQDPDNPNRPDVTQNYGELVGSNVYPEIVRKVQQYTGRNPRQTNPGELMGDMMQSLMSAMRLEQPHREQLEQAAVELVLNLPEFTDAKAAVEYGTLRIDAKLVHPQQMQRAGQLRAHDQPGEEEEEEEPQAPPQRRKPMQVEPQEPEEEEAQEMGLQVPQIRQEYDEEAGKRRFINALIQGAAINKNYAYHEVADQLQAISPQLLQLYGKAMSIAELMYWATPEEQLNTMMGQAGPGGTEELSFAQEPLELPGEGGDEGGDEGGEEPPQEQPQEMVTVATVHARGICFPVLIQEIVKGLYEFLSFNDEEPEEVRSYAHKKSDTLGNEQWDIMQGPGIWRHLNHLVNQANGTEYMGRIFHYLVKLPTGEFNRAMRDILAETPQGLRLIQQLVNEIRQANGPQESLAQKIIRRRLE